MFVARDWRREGRRFEVAALLLAAATWATTVRADETTDKARVERAMAYLDARQEAWSKFAQAGRGEAADRTTCVSCHTGISYALTRSALGRFDAGPVPAPGEERVLADVARRVMHWQELDSPPFRLMYDSDDRKKAESRGTEAVINALLLARDDAVRGRSTSSAPARAALRYLWATQTTEGSDAGSWDWLNFGLAPWEARSSRAFGASLAAIAIGTAPGYLDVPENDGSARGISLLRDYLRRRFPVESVYNRIWLLEASAKLDGLLTPGQTREVIAQLLALQRADGGWALASLGPFQRVDGTDPSQESDGYAAGLAVHALFRDRSSAAEGPLSKGLAWLRAHQEQNGSWRGISVNKERDPATFAGKLMTDAATAISALVLVEANSRSEGSRR
jgi:squalene-hopene/tetraprenyl-beta-curcumene cyclase